MLVKVEKAGSATVRPGPFRVILIIGAATWSLVPLTSPAGGGGELLAAALTLSLPPLASCKSS